MLLRMHWAATTVLMTIGLRAQTQPASAQLQPAPVQTQSTAVETQPPVESIKPFAGDLQGMSIAKQRESVQKQGGKSEGGTFFVLPRPTTLRMTASPFAPAASPSADCDSLAPSEVDGWIETAAKRQELSTDLIRSVIKEESAFRPCAISPKGAQGLMQIMPATAQQFGLSDAFDPVKNIEVGAVLLKQLIVRYNGNLPKALAAYNAGPVAVDAGDRVPGILESQEYVKRVLSNIPVKK